MLPSTTYDDYMTHGKLHDHDNDMSAAVITERTNITSNPPRDFTNTTYCNRDLPNEPTKLRHQSTISPLTFPSSVTSLDKSSRLDQLFAAQTLDEILGWLELTETL
jgi:hypothetical protein